MTTIRYAASGLVAALAMTIPAAAAPITPSRPATPPSDIVQVELKRVCDKRAVGPCSGEIGTRCKTIKVCRWVTVRKPAKPTPLSPPKNVKVN